MVVKVEGVEKKRLEVVVFELFLFDLEDEEVVIVVVNKKEELLLFDDLDDELEDEKVVVKIFLVVVKGKRFVVNKLKLVEFFFFDLSSDGKLLK